MKVKDYKCDSCIKAFFRIEIGHNIHEGHKDFKCISISPKKCKCEIRDKAVRSYQNCSQKFQMLLAENHLLKLVICEDVSKSFMNVTKITNVNHVVDFQFRNVNVT